MNEAPPKPALRNAVTEWQQKHNISNDDPIMATVELWEAFLESERIPEGSITQLRRNVDQMDRICKTLSKQATELVCELRAVPKLKSDLWSFPYFAVIFIAAGALVTGMLIGKFLL